MANRTYEEILASRRRAKIWKRMLLVTVSIGALATAAWGANTYGPKAMNAYKEHSVRAKLEQQARMEQQEKLAAEQKAAAEAQLKIAEANAAAAQAKAAEAQAAAAKAQAEAMKKGAYMSASSKARLEQKRQEGQQGATGRVVVGNGNGSVNWTATGSGSAAVAFAQGNDADAVNAAMVARQIGATTNAGARDDAYTGRYVAQEKVGEVVANRVVTQQETASGFDGFIGFFKGLGEAGNALAGGMHGVSNGSGATARAVQDVHDSTVMLKNTIMHGGRK